MTQSDSPLIVFQYLHPFEQLGFLGNPERGRIPQGAFVKILSEAFGGNAPLARMLQQAIARHAEEPPRETHLAAQFARSAIDGQQHVLHELLSR
jgi:hypothetical protein